MSKYKIEFSSEARIDLIDIAKYIRYNLQEPNISKKIVNKIKNSIYTLSENPKMYPIIDEKFLKKLELRKLVIDNYIVFYKVSDKSERVEIVRIMYGRRNWMRLI